MVADPHLRQPAPAQGANLELRHARRVSSRRQRLEGFRGLFVLLRLVKRLGATEGAFEPGALVGGETVREETGVDAEAIGKPLDRLGRRARLAALDLGDVLLGEPIAGELALRQARGDAELAEPVPEADPSGVGSTSCAAGGLSHRNL